jgi:hypothetical protein
MDKRSAPVGSSLECDPVGVANAAKAVHHDFQALVNLFEQQLAGLPAKDVLRRSHLLEAKAAATRGVGLSEELLGLLRGRD